jgi:transposase
VQWTRAKYFDSELREKKEWIKVHLMCGVKTNVVTSVEVTDQYAGDAPQFPALVERTAKGFLMNEVSADKAYLSQKNLKTVVDNNAMPYIPFKSDSTGKSRTNKQSALWKQMYHYFSYNQERFMKQYHKRSNVETTFHMIKSKFGDALRSKTRRAQINEALCKVLCHNICCLIQAMYELGLKPKFYAEAA